MKSSMSQILLVILAIVFVAALTVTILLICVSYLSDTPSTPPEGTKAPVHTTREEDRFGTLATDASEETTAKSPKETTGSSPKETTARPADTEAPTEEIETAPPLPTGNGLSFASNGNGTCTLVGIGECTDVCIVIPEKSPAGDRVTSIAPRALYACGFVTAIQIPASVTSIGELAFAGCENLVFVSVNVKNPYYCDVDGVLYTADLDTLLVYPAMHSGSSISISGATHRISEMAFYHCAYLSHVYYSGSADQWEQIVIEAKNYSLNAASKTFDSGKK